MSETQERRGYMVTIEWDGSKPPTRWYTYLASRQLNTRRNNGTTDNNSPVGRRASDAGVCFQEGAIIVNSDSLARDLASRAYSCGAVSVMIGVLDMRVFKMTTADEQALDKITTVSSRRGPKPKSEEGRYTVHCFEECETFEVDMRERPLACPHCHGLRIIWWKGSKTTVPAFDAQSHDISKYWLATRFDKHGRFSIPKTDDRATMPSNPDISTFEQGVQNGIGITMDFVHKFAEQVDGDGLEIIHAMDLAFSSNELSKEARQTQRIRALQAYYAGGGTTEYRMSHHDLKVDIVDIAGLDSRYIRYL